MLESSLESPPEKMWRGEAVGFFTERSQLVSTIRNVQKAEYDIEVVN